MHISMLARAIKPRMLTHLESPRIYPPEFRSLRPPPTQEHRGHGALHATKGSMHSSVSVSDGANYVEDLGSSCCKVAFANCGSR
jgi:hypothetical protein